jgi:cell division septation protein DedD
MRDAERLREKIEISFDDRQVWALGLSALLLLGGVFIVGVLVGRKTAVATQPASGDLAALGVQSGPRASGPKESGPRASGLGLRAGEGVAPEKPAATADIAARGSTLAPRPEEVERLSAEKADSDKSAADAEREEKAAAEKSAQGRAPGHASAEQRPATAVPAPRPATVVQPAPQHPLQVASAAQVVLTPPPRDLGAFTVQIGASQDRAEALHMENKARAAGLKPYAVEADLGRKGTWYRVRVGTFQDKDAANSYRRDVERELRSPAVVMPAR